MRRSADEATAMPRCLHFPTPVRAAPRLTYQHTYSPLQIEVFYSVRGCKGLFVCAKRFPSQRSLPAAV